MWGKPPKYHKTKVTPKDGAKLIVVSAKTAEIKEQLDNLKATIAKAFETRRRFWFHTPLEGAYALYVEWKDDGKPKTNAKAAAALFGIKREESAHPLSTIIKIVTPKGVDTRRWVDGLRFAYKQGIAPKDLVAFLKANGGIAGCARKFRAEG
jgi:hypothetical protein